MLTKLQNERKKHHYSLQTMANKLGISKTYYWQLEYGERRLLYSLAEKMAKILGCSTDDLFFEYFKERLNLKGAELYVNKITTNKKRKESYDL